MEETENKTTMINNDQMRFQILKNPRKSAKFHDQNDTPLRPIWSFGWNCKIGLKSILNEDLNEDKSQMFFVSDQIGIILEYDAISKEKMMNMLTGHRNFISSFDVNPDGRWLVTVDKGDKDTMLIVWNALLRTPVFSVLSPSETGISIVKFSVDSQYLITVSIANINGEQTIDIWEWTTGKEESACSTKLDSNIDTIVHVSCCYDNTNFYCLTTEKLVFFMTLEEMDKNNNNKKKIPPTNVGNVNKIIITAPVKDQIQRKYNYTQSVYLTNSRQVVTASTGGWITVWDDNDYDVLTLTNKPITNNKQYLKRVKLDEHCVPTIICIQKHIITGNTNGDVCFYDHSLRILYHLNLFVGDPITSISMFDKQIHVENGTRNCRIFQIDISNKNVIYVFEQCEVDFITALGEHPSRNDIIMGNSIGGLVMFNYRKKEIVTSMIGDREIKEDHRVTSVKFSPNGTYLCYGRADGLFRFVHPYNLTSTMNNISFKWNKSSIQHITFSESSMYVAHTDNSFGIYLYGIKQLQNPNEFIVKYYGCYEVHDNSIRSILLAEYITILMIYTIGADHRIITFEFDKTKDKQPPKLVNTIKTTSFNEPQCMMKSTINKNELNFMISGNDLRLYLWNKNRCICTTRGVSLESPIRVMKESFKYNNNVFFCTDTDIGIIRQPIDGNPNRSAAVLASGTKIIDIGVSMDSMFVFSISENSPSMIIWSVHMSYLDKLEKYGEVGLSAYSSLLEGGKNGPEITELKEYFSCVQLADSRNPETTVISDYVDIFNISFLMRAMGYFPSEIELSNMKYELMFSRPGQNSTKMTFEEFVILYLNYKPQLKLKCRELRLAFNVLIKNDQFVNAYGENKILTRESFVHMMKNTGEKINPRELEIVLNTLLKTTKNISSNSVENADLVHLSLPITYTFEEIVSDLLGFQTI